MKKIAPWSRRIADAGTDLAVRGMNRLSGRGAYGSNALGDVEINDLFTAGDKDDIVLTHTEFLKTITPTTAAFETQYSAILNPGLTSFAPMLAQIAQYYEEYEMLQCVFTFKSTVVDGNDNAAGTVMMATQYNPTNPLFTDDITLDNYAHSCVSKVTADMLHGVECEEGETGQARTEYVRTGPVPAGQDAKTYDMAVFQLATVGAFPALQIGRLYVTYSVRLSKLKLLPVVPLITGINSVSRRAAGATIISTNLFGDAGTETWFDTSLNQFPFIQNGNIIFDPSIEKGKYYIQIYLTIPAAAAITKSSPTVSGGVTLATDSEGPPSSWQNISPGNAVVAANHSASYIIDFNGLTGAMAFNWAGLVTAAGTSVVVFVSQISSSVLLSNPS
jgi:hypothetical protein